ncbi:Uncharacterised protein [Legionella lansingensis]|uniref:Tetratricopeptide repeat protein n=1 Tax=Legionella lansingensis TaxID=45067 RepID=A0A0W0VX10_9GAMM|nr:hypothetical protein [Legionella lansingensis]KTD24731.1 hypothetical protein Llan_0425 [Legionella lansingensis]SNV53601.1 Uncharacterised protein [Legionella lansingensis]
MSLINETLNNLKEKSGKNDRIHSELPQNKANKKINKIKLLSFILIALSVAIVIFISVDHINYSSYYEKTNNLLYKMTTLIGTNSNEIEGTLPNSAQMQYYHALNMLNEGDTKQAASDLKKIIDKYPTFSPAKKAYDRLMESQ